MAINQVNHKIQIQSDIMYATHAMQIRLREVFLVLGYWQWTAKNETEGPEK